MPEATASADGGTGVLQLLETAVTALGGRPRPGQQQMAQAVADAFDTGDSLLVQAGTGTGKSLAYLVPAARHAVLTGSRVVTSTATLALQAQIVTRDLPRLAEALRPSLGRELRFDMVKGRSNYVCRHKLAGQIPDDAEEALFELAPLPGRVLTESATSTLGREVVRLREWAAETDSGDRDDLVPGVSDRAWRQVSVTALECLGQRCPSAGECFSEQVRANARDCDIVVTNHALLAIDTFEGLGILPEHDALVVDEAHELADRVRGAVAAQLGAGAVEAAAGKARRHAGLDVNQLLDAAESLAAAVQDLPQGRFTPRLPQGLAAALAGVRDAARAALTELRTASSGRKDAESAGALQTTRAGLTEIFDVAERILLEDEQEVCWLAVTEGRGGARRTLHVAPLDVSGRLRHKLYENRSVVLTSATLTVGGGFEAVERDVGLYRYPARSERPTSGRPGETDSGGADLPLGTGPISFHSLDVGSPFDYPRQSILYVARTLPAPGRDGPSVAMLDELAALVDASGGRTLGLFSSRAAAEAATEAMRSRLEVPILCQGEDSMAALVRAFAADPATCLFGTMSLWQGVDVPGPACQLVVIDRIPFPRPDDPVASARTETVAKHGGNGFMRVSAQHAALRLAQGAGRLIRGVDDKGVVAVLDSRLATARYGSYLTASLPPMWRTTNRDTVLAALRRLSAAADS